MPRPICVECRLFFRPKLNGVKWEELSPVNLDRTKDPIATEWRSYKLWQSDLWECKGCGIEVIVGHAQQPIAEHFQPDYTEVVEQAATMLRVEDC